MYMNRKQIMKEMKKNKKDKKVVEEDNYISRFIFTVGLILVILIIGYLVIGVFVNKTINFKKETEEKEEVTIDNTTILAGEIFDQKKDNYYVLIYDMSKEDNILSNWKSIYEAKENALTVYVVDSSKKLNANFLVEKDSNKNPTSYDDLKIKSPTLMKIENKKVVDYIEGEEEIKKIFKN